MAATAHPLASAAAVDALRAGGSAVDAALAANAVLAVVEPVSCGLGGDLFALVWDPTARRLAGLDASGRAPLLARRDRAERDALGTIPLRSPHSWTVPGCVAGWFHLHARWGRLPADRVLADATRHAREGFPVTEVVAAAWARGAALHATQPGFAEVFMPLGRAPREGEVFRNPALARVLEDLAEGGADAFYLGRPAEAIAELSAAHGGWLTTSDFRENRPDWVEPIGTTFRGVTVHQIPPPGQGVTVLLLLNLLEHLGVAGLSREDPDWWHLLVEAKKLAYADRARHVADPEFGRVPVAELLSKELARERARLVDRAKAALVVEASDPRLERGDTTYLATADAGGMMVSLIQSNYTGFGSGHAVPELGFGLQNRGAQFALDPAHPNALEPGKRPFHTIIPGFATRAGEPWLAFGVMGGDMQPQGQAQVLLNLLDHGMGLQEAGDAPRFHHGGSSEPTGTVMRDGGVLHLEPEVPAHVRDELRRRGHRVEDADFVYGGYQAVARDLETGCWLGATERRKDGWALGW
jgi:gamma-glutamyltranspeptidase/glutathione hydrolase